MFSITLQNASAFYTLLIALPPALCHVQMTWPAPLRSKYNPSTPENLIDYSISSPLSASGSNFPCKGYQNDPNQLPSTHYTTGSTYNVTLSGEATHGGGSCQLSLSYDKGETFRVIKSMIGGCPETLTYDFTVPSYAPSGEALFAWTWQNKIGNREFYMDCAVVQIDSADEGQQKRQDSLDSMDSLPGIWKADLLSVNDCATVEGENPVYPHPGPDVEYSDGMDSSSPATEGDCDATSPNSEDTGSSSTDPYTSYAPTDGYTQGESAPDNSSNAPENGIYSISLHQKAPSTATIPDSAASSPGQLRVAPSQEASITSSVDPGQYATDAASTRSTATVYVDCPGTITMTIYPSETPPVSPSPPTYTTSVLPSACTGASAVCPCAVGYDCRSIGTCTWACIAQGQTSSSGFRTTTSTSRPSSSSTSSSSTSTTKASVPTSSSTPPTSSSPPPQQTPNKPPYASPSEIQTYLPCVPGTFICSSPTEWYTCDYNGATDPSRPSTAWVYTAPRQVAAGMECMPFLAAYSASNQQYAQQNKAPRGYYRDDQYVRAGSAEGGMK